MMQRASVFPGFYGRLAIALGGVSIHIIREGQTPPQTRVGRGAEALNSPIKNRQDSRVPVGLCVFPVDDSARVESLSVCSTK